MAASQFDSFGVEDMGKEEYKEKQTYVINSCKCKECPTYVSGDNPTGYCFPLIGTSEKIHHEEKCICGTCPIYKEFELNHTFYCTRCSQVCQSHKGEALVGP